MSLDAVAPYLSFSILCLPALCYYLGAIYGAVNFFSHPQSRQPESPFQPPLTVLKPICGLDEETYENFASLCLQDYPEYQIVFGVQDPNDPCIAVVHQIAQDFPHRDIQLVIDERTIGTNLKVSNLDNALAAAKHPLLVLADSDVRVDPYYLQSLIRPLQDPQVGAVTCLYRPVTQGWVANLEGIGISTDYLASVLVARQVQRIDFALGPTIALRREVLEGFGGFAAIADCLADDYQIGYLTVQSGYQVVLCDYVIDHVISTRSLPDLFRRQVRWALCTRVSRPWGYLGLWFTHGLASSLVYLVWSGGSLMGWLGAGLIWSVRLVMAWVMGAWGLKDPKVRRLLWLVPLWDLIGFGIWCYCLVGNRIKWRGRHWQLTRGGKLVPLKGASRGGKSPHPLST